MLSSACCVFAIGRFGNILFIYFLYLLTYFLLNYCLEITLNATNVSLYIKYKL